MEVKINKEIRDYTESIFFGLNLRQLICSICACLTSVGLYFLLRNYLGKEMLSWICIVGAIPFGAMGFVKYNGMTAEQLVAEWFKSEVLMPSILHFKPENIYEELLKDEYKRIEKEEMKIENKPNKFIQSKRKRERKSKNS